VVSGFGLPAARGRFEFEGGHKQASKDMAEQANLAPKQGYGSARGKAKEVEAGYEGGRHGTTT
jgi:hypothetical protein